MKNSIFTTKKLIQIRFKWYSLLTDLVSSDHFSKCKLKYGAMLLTLAVAGSCNSKNNNSKDLTSDSDSIPEQQMVTCYEPAAPPESIPPPKEKTVLPLVEVNPEVTCYKVLIAPVDTNAEKIHRIVDIQPQFPGGDAELINYLSKNLKYPENALINDAEGRVFVQFVVNKTGMILNIEILRSLHPDFDREAIRLIESMPKWIPGEQNGEPVNAYYVLPIRFKIDKTN